MSTYTVYQKAFYADKKKLFCFIKSGIRHQWNNQPACRQTCPISFNARGKVRETSHLVPGHGARVRYSLGTNVNTPFFPSIPTLEFGHGARVRVQARDLVLGHESGHRAPLCTSFLLVLWPSTALKSLQSACF